MIIVGTCRAHATQATQATRAIHASHPTRGALHARREALRILGAPALLLVLPERSDARDAGDWSTPGLSGGEISSDMPEFEKLASGVVVQRLAEGQGVRVAQAGDVILLDYVLRRANGYFIYSTLEGVSFQPQDVPTGPVRFKLDDSMLPGLVDAIIGMKKGGRRRVLVPPEVGYLAGSGLQPTMPTYATNRQLENHKREPLVFELEVVSIS